MLHAHAQVSFSLRASTFAHVLCDNVNGLFRHHGVKLHQLVMVELLHDLSLLQERLWGHGTRPQGLHRHLCGAIPGSWHTQKRFENTLSTAEKERTSRFVYKMTTD